VVLLLTRIEEIMKIPFLRTPYNYNRDDASNESGLECQDPTLAQQQFREECDINTIMERFGRTGELVAPVRMPQYGDFDGINDYHSAMNAIVEAQSAFDQLPAKIRARFGNDPAEFVEFAMNEENRDEAIRLGLVEAAIQAPAPVSEPSVDGSAQ
jgi:phage internal scaffolding protein